MLLYSFTFCFLVGFAEELFYRDFLLNFFLERLHHNRRELNIAILINGFIFGLSHFTNLFSSGDVKDAIVQVVHAILGGIIYAGLYVKTRNLLACIVLHFANDFAVLAPKMVFENVIHFQTKLRKVSAIEIGMLLLLILCLGASMYYIAFVEIENSKIMNVMIIIAECISVILCWTGMFWGFGLISALYVKKRKTTQGIRSKRDRIEFSISMTGFVLGLIGFISIMVYFLSLGRLDSIMIYNKYFK